MAGDTFLEQFAIGPDTVSFGTSVTFGRYGKIPIPLDLDYTLLVYFQRVPGEQFAYSPEHGLFASDVTERKILCDRTGIEFRLYAWISKNRLDLGGKKKFAAIIKIIERFDPKPVAGNEKPTQGAIPDGKGKHAAKMLHALAPMFLI